MQIAWNWLVAKALGLLRFIPGPLGVLTGLWIGAQTVLSGTSWKVKLWVGIAVLCLIAFSVSLLMASHRGAERVVTATVNERLANHERSATIETHVRSLPVSAARKRLLHDWSVR